MRNNNLKNIIKVINTALLVSTLTLSLTACGRTDGKSDNSDYDTDNYTENGNKWLDDNSQQPVYNDTFSYVSGKEPRR